jgi:hypothetical protein
MRGNLLTRSTAPWCQELVKVMVAAKRWRHGLLRGGSYARAFSPSRVPVPVRKLAFLNRAELVVVSPDLQKQNKVSVGLKWGFEKYHTYVCICQVIAQWLHADTSSSAREEILAWADERWLAANSVST